MKIVIRTLFLLLLLAVGTLLTRDDLDQLRSDVAGQIREIAGSELLPSQPANSGPLRPEPAPVVDQPSVRDSDTVRIASFNIQVFGTSKSNKPDVMAILASVVRRFDIVAIQEVRAKDQSVIPRFVDLVNSDGAHYQSVVGPRLGRTTSKEQYAFVYDATRIEVDRQSIYTLPDPRDLLHREPLVARFRVRGPPPTEAFTFTLVNIHTDPDETKTELNALDDALVAIRRNGSQEDDVILLGDLNVDPARFGDLGRLPNIAWAISGMTTNTRGTKSYDNIVFDRVNTTEFVGEAGVLNLMTEFSLSKEAALKVSDHLPVWATFRSTENRVQRLAESPSDGSRIR